MEMTYDEARQYVVEHPEAILKKAAKFGYICPCCGSGSGTHGTGITEAKRFPNRFTCWAGGCFSGATVIDIVAKTQGLSPRKAFFYCLDANGIKLSHSEHQAADIKPMSTPQKPSTKPEPTVPPEVIKSDIAQALKSPKRYEYLAKRGISPFVQAHFKVGFIENWITPKLRGKTPYISPRCIIPTNAEGTSYLARDVRETNLLTESQKNYTKMKTGENHQFNWEILKRASGPVVITEGEIDAMSVYQSGQLQVIALGSTAYMNSLLSYLKEHNIPQNVSFGIMLDNDTVGRKASENLRNGLTKLGYQSEDVSSLLAPYKDANEALCANSRVFIMRIRKKIAGLKQKNYAR